MEMLFGCLRIHVQFQHSTILHIVWILERPAACNSDKNEVIVLLAPMSFGLLGTGILICLDLGTKTLLAYARRQVLRDSTADRRLSILIGASCTSTVALVAPFVKPQVCGSSIWTINSKSEYG